MKDILSNLEKTSDRLSKINAHLLSLAKKGDKWTCIHCGYVIIVGNDKQSFSKKISIHTDLCLNKLEQEILNEMRKTKNE